jgi:hypothetical protein
MATKGRGFREVLVEGFVVLVGKGEDDNDRLTFRVAEPHDFWLHVAGFSGSHVVVRNPDRLDALPRDVEERAAELAVWHSKARGTRGKVECTSAGRGRRQAAPSRPAVRLRAWRSVRSLDLLLLMTRRRVVAGAGCDLATGSERAGFTPAERGVQGATQHPLARSG